MMDIDASNILNKIAPLRSNYHCHSLTLKSYFYISINAQKNQTTAINSRHKNYQD